MSANKNPTIPVAVFDISSGSVGGAHALVRKDETPDINKVLLLAQKRFNSPLQTELTISRFVNDTLRNIERVAFDLQKETPHHIPDFVQIVLASPWYTSQTRKIFYDKNTEFTCTEKLVKEIISKEVNHILIHEKETFGDLGNEYVIVEKQISKIKINGYATDDPYGKKCKNIELYLNITVAPKKILDDFKSAIERIYKIKKIHFTTSAYTTHIAMRENSDVSDNSVAIDVGEEITDIAFIKDGVFLHQYSFPVGTYELYRKVAKNTQSTHDESVSLLEAYKSGTLNEKNNLKINQSLMDFMEDWQNEIRKVVDSNTYGFVLSKDWYVVIEKNFEFLVKDKIENDEYLRYKANSKIKVDVVTEDEIKSFIKPFDLELDIPIALALIFAEKII